METDLKELLRKNIRDVVKKEYSIDLEDVFVEHPENENWGDYATSIAMKLANDIDQSPIEIAKDLSYKLSTLALHFERSGSKYQIFDKIDFAPPGFINFKISQYWLQNVLYHVQEVGEHYGRGDWLEYKKVIIEYTDPNPFKVFHIGHLMSNCIGESLSRMLEFGGADLRRANYQGDVGMHVAKSIWGMKKLLKKRNVMLETLGKRSISERVEFLGEGYTLGATAFEDDEEAKNEMTDINYLVFISAQEYLKNAEDWKPQVDYSQYLSKVEGWGFEEVKGLYETGRSWSLEYFETIYARLGTRFDFYYFESVVGEFGLKVVKEYLEKGVFEENEGAIIFDGKKHGLHTRVFVNSLGLPTYEAKDLGLAHKKYTDFPYEQSIIVTANEIAEYFKVVLMAMSQVYPELEKKTRHIPHGMMKLGSGKMSSRTGDVVTGPSLIDDVKELVLDKMDASDTAAQTTADQIAVGALKFDILKHGIGKDIVFDKEKSLSVVGNTGPYLQYTHARANSVLNKGGFKVDLENVKTELRELEGKLTVEEISILRLIYRFPEVIERAGMEFSPNHLCEYLFQLAQRFNLFYNNVPILAADNAMQKNLRLLLTKSVKDVLKSGLYLLGIEAPDKI